MTPLSLSALWSLKELGSLWGIKRICGRLWLRWGKEEGWGWGSIGLFTLFHLAFKYDFICLSVIHSWFEQRLNEKFLEVTPRLALIFVCVLLFACGICCLLFSSVTPLEYPSFLGQKFATVYELKSTAVDAIRFGIVTTMTNSCAMQILSLCTLKQGGIDTPGFRSWHRTGHLNDSNWPSNDFTPTLFL